VAAQGAHELAGGAVALQQAASDPEQIVPVVGDEVRVESVAGELVQRPVVGDRIKPPEPGAAGIGEAWGELVAEQSEAPEDDVGVAGGVGHDLAGPHAGLRVKQPVEQVQRVGLGAGHDHGVDRDVVIDGGGQGGDAAAAVVVAAVEAGVDGAVGGPRSAARRSRRLRRQPQRVASSSRAW